MPTNNFPIPRRWERQQVAMPIGLVLQADHFKADDTAQIRT